MAYKFIIKPFLRIFLYQLVEKELEKFRKGSNQGPRRPEGSIHVDYIPPENRTKERKNDNDGEYVDYEEVR